MRLILSGDNKKPLEARVHLLRLAIGLRQSPLVVTAIVIERVKNTNVV